MTNPDDLSQYSKEDKEKINRRARRNVTSETVLILSAGFAFLMVLTFFLAKVTFLPIAVALGIRPIFVWVGLNAILATIWAIAHRAIFAPRIARAKTLSAALLHHHEALEQEKNRAKIAEMNARQ